MKIPSLLSTLSFVTIVLGLCLLLLFGIARAGRAGDEAAGRTRRIVGASALGLGAWLAITGSASASGLLARAAPIPLLLPFVLLSLGVAAFAAASRLGTRLIRGVSIAALVGFQGFRVPLEFVLHRWVEQGVLPVQMSYSGDNFDIVSGALAIVIALWSWRADEPPRLAILAWNVLGSALLLAVMSIAILSSPTPLRIFRNDPPLLLPFHFPYGFIIPFCVGGALFGHVLVFRWLAATRSA